MQTKVLWVNEVDRVKDLIQSGKTPEQIGKLYGVSKQRMYQVLQKYSINTPIRTKKGYLSGKPVEVCWLAKMLRHKTKYKGEEFIEVLESIHIPKVCPALGIVLNYDGTGKMGWGGREESSPSIYRLDSGIGYVKGNMHIISWRANRIKSDSAPRELRLLADYMDSLSRQNNTC